MPFVEIPGLAAKLFVPEEKTALPKKYNCKDCYVCQWCRDERCEACLKSHCSNAENKEEDSMCKISRD